MPQQSCLHDETIPIYLTFIIICHIIIKLKQYQFYGSEIYISNKCTIYPFFPTHQCCNHNWESSTRHEVKRTQSLQITVNIIKTQSHWFHFSIFLTGLLSTRPICLLTITGLVPYFVSLLLAPFVVTLGLVPFAVTTGLVPSGLVPVDCCLVWF